MASTPSISINMNPPTQISNLDDLNLAVSDLTAKVAEIAKTNIAINNQFALLNGNVKTIAIITIGSAIVFTVNFYLNWNHQAKINDLDVRLGALELQDCSVVQKSGEDKLFQCNSAQTTLGMKFDICEKSLKENKEELFNCNEQLEAANKNDKESQLAKCQSALKKSQTGKKECGHSLTTCQSEKQTSETDRTTCNQNLEKSHSEHKGTLSALENCHQEKRNLQIQSQDDLKNCNSKTDENAKQFDNKIGALQNEINTRDTTIDHYDSKLKECQKGNRDLHKVNEEAIANNDACTTALSACGTRLKQKETGLKAKN